MDYEDQLTGLATPAVVTSGGVITLGRRRYAVGLYWQPSPSGRVSQAAREAARQPGQMADFFAVRTASKQSGRVPQFGLGQKEFGHAAGLPTGAASLAEEQPGSWGGVFKVPEGWWLVISRDDLIAPDGDILYDNESAARQRLHDEIELGGLQRIYAPDTWNLGDSDPIPLSLLMQGRAEARLQNVDLPIRTYMVAAGAVLGLCLVGYVIFLWQQAAEQEAQLELERMTAEAQALAELNRKSQLNPAAPPAPPKRTWEDAPLTEIWLDACRNAMSTAPATAVGWTRGEVSCQGTSLSVNWKRDAGPADVPPSGVISPDRQTATSTFTFVDVPKRSTEALWQKDALELFALRNNLPLETQVIPEVETPPVAPGAPPATLSPWLKKKITINSQTAPWFVWQSYVSIPGLVIDRITWTGKDWVTEGTFYELR